MRRFFFVPTKRKDALVSLNSEESHHISKVLRLDIGEEVELLDGKGSLFKAVIISVGKQVTLNILEQIAAPLAENTPLWVCQGDLKGKKMDLVVQKCTELGVRRLLSFTSSRSQGRTPEKRINRKYERWQKLVESACKQSKRLELMEFEERSFSDLLRSSLFIDADLKLICWEEEHDNVLSDINWQKPCEKVCLMLGPEGGFSMEEVELARGSGWKSISLGKQILRAETATLAAVSIVQHRLGYI